MKPPPAFLIQVPLFLQGSGKQGSKDNIIIIIFKKLALTSYHFVHTLVTRPDIVSWSFLGLCDTGGQPARLCIILRFSFIIKYRPFICNERPIILGIISVVDAMNRTVMKYWSLNLSLDLSLGNIKPLPVVLQIEIRRKHNNNWQFMITSLLTEKNMNKLIAAFTAKSEPSTEQILINC